MNGTATVTGRFGSGGHSTFTTRKFMVERHEPRNLFAAPVDPVLEWNNVLIDTLRADRVYPGPGFSSLHAAMMHTAIYDAVMAIDGGHASYLGKARAAKGSDRTAAVAAAGWRVLSRLYPVQ